MASYLDYNYYDEYVNKIKKAAPYGLIDEWGWDSDSDFITFNLSYTNLNPKTIKYIKICIVVTNNVNDVRQVVHFLGTGPVKLYETASWSWDNLLYYVLGYTSNMSITKIILTYMNGTRRILTGKMLKFN